MREPSLQKKNKFQNKKIIYVIVLIALVSLISVSYAFYYSSHSFINRFKTMTYNVNLIEEFNNDFGVKRVKIVNNEETNTSVVLRLNINETWKKTISGEEIILSNNNSNLNCVYKTWTSDFLNDFILGDDGWYYYKKILKAEDEVLILESISDNGCNYTDMKYELDVNYEAIQADSNAVLEIWNYDISISDDLVTWPFTGTNPNINQVRGE